MRRISWIAAVAALCLPWSALLTVDAARGEDSAKQVFGRSALPAALKPASIGFYSKGCLAGGVAIPVDGPDWQVMRLSRNRRWGHPVLIQSIETLSRKAKEHGWNGLMVGDISQPRGGPMLTGHASHQIGLDADIWFTPMPDRRLSYREREELSAISMLKGKSFYVDDALWTRSHEAVLREAARLPEVERVLVHPGIKKKLCDSVKGDRRWLEKIRPNWGHHYHFHIRIACQDGSPACKKQADVGGGEGCDASLDWWFEVGLVPRKSKKDENDRPPREMRMGDLPPACRSVIEAPARPADQAQARIRDAGFSAPPLEIPAYDPAVALRSKPIESRGPTANDLARQSPPMVASTVPAAPEVAASPAASVEIAIPVPVPRPQR